MNGEKRAVRSARVKQGFALMSGMAALWGCGSEGMRAMGGAEPPGTTMQRVTYGEHTYFFSNDHLTWAGANEVCTRMGMGLVTLDDAAEEQWVASNFALSFPEWWLGLNDIATEGVWKWSGAQPTSTYTHWRPGEPNAESAADDCGVYTPQGGWIDMYCNYHRPFACESIQPRAAQYNGHDYLFYPQGLTREKARYTCREQGYDLVTINDSAENAWLKTQVPTGQSSWIGFNDQAQEGSWRWADSSQVTYLNWRPSEPNNTGGSEHCAVNNAPATSSAPGGAWNDVSCGEQFPFICERVLPPEGYEHFLYGATATTSATQLTMDFEILLDAGQTLEIGTCGMPTAYALRDTFLRLNGPDGLEVTSNDDDCKGLGSRIRYRVPACGAGAYVLKAGCSGETSCEGRLVFRVIPAPQP